MYRSFSGEKHACMHGPGEYAAVWRVTDRPVAPLSGQVDLEIYTLMLHHISPADRGCRSLSDLCLSQNPGSP